ncbi:hypothetical protein [Vibrio sp. SCSIO 43155]|uniref:hypothetical protein n=1 Tax=Vibrio TaxID=662 RepID=UPI002074B9EF|nr:hypothetical protein [Vibrio sp. SCSIO 43155]USD58543.1 hypothetical protein J4N44_28010 [Vibrio sp. SCSIO 43155]
MLDYVVSEPTALFTIPFMVTLGQNAFDLLNESGLLFVPFFFAMVKSVVKSRALGQDEGEAQIMCLKMIEAEWLPMAFVLFFAVMPARTSVSPVVSYKAYSCANTPALIENAETIANLKPNSVMATQYGSNNMSLIMGLVHQGSTAFNGLLIGKLFCEQGINRYEVGESLLNANVKSRAISKAVLEFDAQCYQRAADEVDDAARTNTLVTKINDRGDAYFNSLIMKSSYDGTLRPTRQPQLLFDKPPQWDKEMNTYTNGTSSISCQQAANEVEQTLKLTLGKEQPNNQPYDEWVGDIQSLLNSVDMTTNVSFAEAQQELLGATYTNIISGTKQNPSEQQKVTQANSQSTAETYNKIASGRGYYNHSALGKPTEVYNTYNGYVVDQARAAKEAKDRNNEINSLVYFGSAWGNLIKTVEQATYIRLAPALISVVQGIILAMMPIVMFLSGFSPKILMQICLAYFAISLIPFWINFGLMVETILSGLVESKGQLLPIETSTASQIVDYAGTLSIIFLCTGWLTLFQMLGVRIVGMMDTANSASTGAGQGANMMLNSKMNDIQRVSQNSVLKNTGGNGENSKEAIKERISQMSQRAEDRLKQYASELKV